MPSQPRSISALVPVPVAIAAVVPEAWSGAAKDRESSRDRLVLSRDRMREAAPSLFACRPRPGTTSRRAFIPTIEIVSVLEHRGFLPVLVRQAEPRRREDAPFVKHMVRMRRFDDDGGGGGGAFRDPKGGVFEIVLINSPSGRASHRLLRGLHRFAGDIDLVLDDDWDRPVGLHSSRAPRRRRAGIDGFPASIATHFAGGGVGIGGDDRRSDRLGHRVLNAIDLIAGSGPDAVREIESWRRVRLSTAEQVAFARAAAAARRLPDIEPTSLLRGRRVEDLPGGDGSRDLWAAIGVVQETLARGGASRFDSVRRRFAPVPLLAGLDADVRLSRSLCALARATARRIGGT